MNATLVIVVSLVLSLLAFSLIAFAIFRLVRSTLRQDDEKNTNPNVHPLHFVFGLLFMLLVYPTGFKSVFRLMNEFFDDIMRVVFAGQMEDSSPFRVFQAVFNGQIWYEIILFVFGVLVTAFVSSRLVSYFDDEEETAPQKNGRRILLKNSLVVGILALALFLSISAIIAIPIVSYQSQDDSQLAASLRVEINEVSRKDSSLQAEFIATFQKQQRQLEADSSLQDENILNSYFSGFKRGIESVFEEINILDDQAVSRVQATANSNINNKLKLKDKSQVLNWYLNNRKAKIAWLDLRQSSLNRYILLHSDSTNLSDELSQTVYASLFNVKQPITTPMPPRPALGSDLGVFSFFAGWLLKVESYPLVIIIGLIGFGLLGAAGATFIKEKGGQGQQSKVLIEDLAGVMIKGFTAAIVVFLGVQGSLAVLTTESGELNAYALFFVAFVASVFSDDAWNWAHKRFQKDFDGSAPQAETPEIVSPPTEPPATDKDSDTPPPSS